MIGNNWEYKGFSFSDYISKETGIVLNQVTHNVPTRFDIFPRANAHGSFSSNALLGGRIFLFDGTIFAPTRSELSIIWNELLSTIQPPANPGDNGFFDLSWETLDGQARVVKAKVVSMPDPNRDKGGLSIDFSFELYCEQPYAYGGSIKSEAGFTGLLGGTTWENNRENSWDSGSNIINVTNSGNWQSGVYIGVAGSATNLHFINITSNTHYSINGDTSAVILDTLNLNQVTGRYFSVKDGSTDISSRRNHGTGLFLLPGNNSIVVISDNTTPALVTIQYFDSFIY